MRGAFRGGASDSPTLIERQGVPRRLGIVFRFHHELTFSHELKVARVGGAATEIGGQGEISAVRS